MKLLKLYVTLAYYYYNVFHFPLYNLENALQVRANKGKKISLNCVIEKTNEYKNIPPQTKRNQARDFAKPINIPI